MKRTFLKLALPVASAAFMQLAHAQASPNAQVTPKPADNMPDTNNPHQVCAGWALQTASPSPLPVVYNEKHFFAKDMSNGVRLNLGGTGDGKGSYFQATYLWNGPQGERLKASAIAFNGKIKTQSSADESDDPNMPALTQAKIDSAQTIIRVTQQNYENCLRQPGIAHKIRHTL